MNPQPFPWHLLEHTTHAEALSLRDVRRWLSVQGASSVLLRSNELARTQVEVEVVKASNVPAPVRAGWIGVAFELDGNAERCAILCEAAAAATLVSRSMKRTAPRVVDPKRAAPLPLAGAFAALIVAASRAGARGPARVVWCGDGAAVGSAQLAARLVAVDAKLRIEGDGFEALLLVPEDATRNAPNPPFSRADLAALQDLPITLKILAAASVATREELRSLAVGDVWMPGRFLQRSDRGNFFGDVVLASPARDHGLRARLGEDGELSLLDDAKETAMSADGIVTEGVGQAPVIVRVEVGAVTLEAREWSALRAGDVISTKHKISEPIVLRVAGVEVGRGELVDVEGEIGVRILSRT